MLENKYANCLAFLTHRINNDILRYLAYLQNKVDGILDLWVLYDCSLQDIDINAFPKLKVFKYAFHTIDNFFHQGDNSLQNPLLALMKFAEYHEYSHYLLMENDIVLNGCFSEFARRINAETEIDYIHIATDVLGGHEAHWPIKYIRDNPFAVLHFSWCQMFYISKRYLDAIGEFVLVNNSFYYEFLLPTMAYNRMFHIKQFENFGYQFCLSWGPAEFYEYKYSYERQHNTFYHPIKQLGIVDFV